MEHLELAGHPHEMGLSHGRLLAGTIRRLLADGGYDADGLRSALAARRAQPQAGSSSDPVHDMCRRLGLTLDARCPNLVEEMRGIAEGAGATYQDILLLNVGYDAEGEFLSRVPQCTAVGLPGTDEGPLLAKTEDVNPVQWESQAFFRVRPREGHAFLVYSLAGTVWVDGGVNEAGLGLVMTGLGPAGPDPAALRHGGRGVGLRRSPPAALRRLHDDAGRHDVGRHHRCGKHADRARRAPLPPRSHRAHEPSAVPGDAGPDA
jgi:isopenicillin-N N-acyltransferase-like protein